MAEVTAYFTTGQRITVIAMPPRQGLVDHAEPLNGKHYVEVSFPGHDGYQITAVRIYPDHDSSKAAANAIADEINKITRLGFPFMLKSFRTYDFQNQERIEKLVRGWAGEDGNLHMFAD